MGQSHGGICVIKRSVDSARRDLFAPSPNQEPVGRKRKIMSSPGNIECFVCNQPMPQSRLHYGGVSCYSCRAFFRRNTQKGERLGCKENGRCLVTFKNRKVCTQCRYDK